MSEEMKTSAFQLNQMAYQMWSRLESAETEEEVDACCDTIESIECLQEDKLVAYCHVMRNMAVDIAAEKARAQAMQEEVDRVKARAQAMENKRERLAKMAGEMMGLMGRTKLEADGVKMSMRKYGGGSVAVRDETLIPAEYFVPQPAKLDKKAIMAALKEAGSVPGCELVEPTPKFEYRF